MNQFDELEIMAQHFADGDYFKSTPDGFVIQHMVAPNPPTVPHMAEPLPILDAEGNPILDVEGNATYHEAVQAVDESGNLLFDTLPLIEDEWESLDAFKIRNKLFQYAE
jgi:hypothetical protein